MRSSSSTYATTYATNAAGKSQSRRSNLSIASQCCEAGPRYRPASALEAAEDRDAAGDGRHASELGPGEPLAEEDDSSERGEGGELRREDGADRDTVTGADREGGKPSDLARAREHHPRRGPSSWPQPAGECEWERDRGDADEPSRQQRPGQGKLCAHATGRIETRT